jgi:S1-C subfamily serine protease
MLPYLFIALTKVGTMYKIILALVFMNSIAFSGEPDKLLHEKCLYPTIMIINQNSIGTGVIVKSMKLLEVTYDNYAFTCAHVLIPEPTKPPEIDKYKIKARVGVYENWSTLVGYTEHQCEVLYIDQKKDIALIKFKSENHNFTADVEKDPKIFIGNQICRVGCGMGEPFRLDFGQLTSASDSIGNMIKNTYRVNIPTIMGDSGGPVYHEYKLFGLAKAVRSLDNLEIPISHIAYVVPVKSFYESEAVIQFLKY